MKRRLMNPYLPLDEYIPDSEPRVFGDRLYVYGSHDFAGGEKGYCPGDYMAYSAPLEDLSEWTCHGVLFKRDDCPEMTEDDAMAAPDVVKGVDGRFYLYFNTNNQKVCRVAVSDRPEGPFHYYGDVGNSDGTPYTTYKMFDPGVLVDDGHVYLYTGFCMAGPVPEKYKDLPSPFADFSMGFELDKDMKTIIAGPFPIIPGDKAANAADFVGHCFYEASSPRKICGKYVMVYSSEVKHELCYAISNKPLSDYVYGGVIVSNADLGLNGNTAPVMPYGNNHGGLVKIEDQWFIFYHRQTHGVECSRQGMAEPVEISEDVRIKQVEITSQGLSCKPIRAEGTMNACYACYLWGEDHENRSLSVWENRSDTEPHIYEKALGNNTFLHYINNIKNKTTIGFKYFEFLSNKKLFLTLAGEGDVHIRILDNIDGRIFGEKDVTLAENFSKYEIDVEELTGVGPLYIEFSNMRNLSVMELSF